ncbi:MAG: hypothetical protein HRJ53_24530 [Acidobacteria bacterium Pan2503]|uniref:Uncharacterized protein n=1 Tax=Candidatus Acidiferrum panamense TaxID=2741543 RepID=A0A7V8NV94_9BACT|nr:hypothetical protein [Candidatus Acidoferrum panamensis]
MGNTPATQVAAVGIRQIANGQSTLFLQRFTDVSSTGNLIEGWNAADNFQTLKIDTFGNITANAFYSQNPSTQVNSVINVKQPVNGLPAVVIQRNTDSGPSGNLMACVNVANNLVIASIDTGGNVLGASVIAYSNAPAVGAGNVAIGGTTATTATAGANGAVPAQVAGYININVAGTAMKLPYFNT